MLKIKNEGAYIFFIYFLLWSIIRACSCVCEHMMKHIFSFVNRSTCHVLILTPFIVLCIVISRTVMFETQAFVLSLPRLPMLIPCPGPQFTLCMYTFEHPVWIETQSSPERIRIKIISHLFSSTSNFYLKIFACSMLIIYIVVVVSSSIKTNMPKLSHSYFRSIITIGLSFYNF